MTRRRTLERHRHSLAEIRDIMNSMKTLAYIETRKLDPFLDAQHAVLQSIEDVAADLLSFYPETLPEAKVTKPVYLLMGTERGFCGDFNHALLRFQASTPQENSLDSPMLVAIGRKLNALLEKDAHVAARIGGASVVEEAATVLSKVVSELTALQDEQGILTVFCFYHRSRGDIIMRKLLPPFQHLLQKSPRLPYAPDLNLPPREFLVELTDHYVFAALHEMLYSSLMAENQQRVAHLERAVKHLDDESAELSRQYNALRQEEIIEEIEVILLGATSLSNKI